MKAIMTIFNIVLMFCVFANVTLAKSAPVILNGHQLTIANVVDVASHHAKVAVDANSMTLVERSHALLLLAAKKDMPVYGLNRGVGLNKDKVIFHGDALSENALRQSEQFNLNDIYATSAGIGSIASREVVRAAMLVRLNTLLLGHSGVQPAVVTMLVDLLNDDITPVMPSEGSIGEADITILAHLALAMTGRGEVMNPNGKIIPASVALKQAGLTPLHLYGKDALSIFSSNAYTAGKLVLAVSRVQTLLDQTDVLVALSLEGINGNIAPYLPVVNDVRPFEGQMISATNVLHALSGSYLMKPSSDRALQDPLSFRTASQLNGAARDALKQLTIDLLKQINSADDNPTVILDVEPAKNASLQEKSYYLREGDLYGAVIPTANFEPISWVLDAEKLNIALGHLSAASTQRIVKLGSFCINQISRFLSPDQATIAFAAIQKPIMYLNTETQQEIIPVSTLSYPVAGDIEDTATNSLLVVNHMDKIIDNLYETMAFELLHASQAVDLKHREYPSMTLGVETNQLQRTFRASVPFLAKDRELTPDIQKAIAFIQHYRVEKR